MACGVTGTMWSTLLSRVAIRTAQLTTRPVHFSVRIGAKRKLKSYFSNFEGACDYASKPTPREYILLPERLSSCLSRRFATSDVNFCGRGTDIIISSTFRRSFTSSIPCGPSHVKNEASEVQIDKVARSHSVFSHQFSDHDNFKNVSHTSVIRHFRIFQRPRILAGVTKRRSVRQPFSTSANSSSSRSSASASASASTPSSSTLTRNSTPDDSVSDTSSAADSAKPASERISLHSDVQTTNKRISWKEAAGSPRKAAMYVAQMSRDLVDWARHMWAGVKLLSADVRVSWRVLHKISLGKAITRRERNFLVQTGVDLARLVPFSLFLIIPLAEFALPFALRLFPNMLPSQFQSNMQKEERMKRQLKANIEIAKYLSEVVEEKAKAIRASHKDSAIKNEAAVLADFLEAIRHGKAVDVSEVSRFARLFNDELTLDGAVRPQLVAMCKYMGITAHGTDQLLRFRLRSRLNSIKNDDMQIMWEGGSNSLTDDEVVKACRDRGIRVAGVPKQIVRKQLSDWLEMSQDKAIPGSLMIMSRAFLYSGVDGLKETLSSLPDDVYEDVKMAADGGEASTIDRLEEARRQGKLIEIEIEREARKAKEIAEKKVRLEEQSRGADHEGFFASSDKLRVSESVKETIDDARATAAATVNEARIVAEKIDESLSGTAASPRQAGKVDKSDYSAQGHDLNSRGNVVDFKVDPSKDADVTDGSSSHRREVAESRDAYNDGPEKDEEQRAKDREAIRRVVDALDALSSESAVEVERAELDSLKNELAEADSVLQALGSGHESELRRLKKMVSKLEKQVERVDAKVGASMKLLDMDNDGVMSMEECKSAVKLLADDERDATVVTEALHRLDADSDGNISKSDFHRLLNELQSETAGIKEEFHHSSSGEISDKKR